MMEKASSIPKMGKKARTRSVEAGGHSTVPAAISSNTEKGSVNSVKSETEVKAPDGGWGWVIVIASFFTQLIGG